MEGETSKIKKLALVERLNLNMSDPMNANLFSIFIENNLSANTTKLLKIETALNLRCDSAEKQLNDKVNTKTFKALEEKMCLLEAAPQTKRDKFSSITEKVESIDLNLKDFQIKIRNFWRKNLPQTV